MAVELPTEPASTGFDAVSAETNTSVSYEAACNGSVFGFQDEIFVGPVTRFWVTFRPGSQVATVVYLTLEQGVHLQKSGELVLEVDITVSDEQFATLFRHLWVSTTPTVIQAAIALPCFYLLTALAQDTQGNFLLETGREIEGQLQDIWVERHLTAHSDV